MARLNVNPTRMELTKLKKSLVVARRGHKLLKDKRDELMKQFLELVRKNKELRYDAEDLISESHKSFVAASAVMSEENLEEALMYPSRKVGTEMTSKNIMSVEVPIFNYKIISDSDDIYCYGFESTTSELDKAVSSMDDFLPVLLELAGTEKAAQLLAREIERTRRRVNALEYVKIPQLEETIKYITMKLEENERGNTIRLMKVKDMVIKEKMEHDGGCNANSLQ